MSDKINTEAVAGNLYKVMSFIENYLNTINISPMVIMKIIVAAEEIFVNIVQYAYAPNTGMVTVSVNFFKVSSKIAICFSDSGIPYNPLEKEDPDVSLPIEQRDIGGLGIFLAKKLLDEVKYEYTEGKNKITLIKKL